MKIKTSGSRYTVFDFRIKVACSSCSRLAWNWTLLFVLFAATALVGLQVNGFFSAVHGSCVPAVSLLTAGHNGSQINQQMDCCGISVQLSTDDRCHCAESGHPVFRKTPAVIISANQEGVQLPLLTITLPLWREQPALLTAVRPEYLRQPFSLALTQVRKTVLLI